MGVIDDADVDKIVEAYKKTRTWKGFYDPKKASNAFYVMFVIAYVGIIVCAGGWFVTWGTVTTQEETLNDYVKFTDIVVEQSDCSSLKSILKELRHDDFTGTVIGDIKSEIEFRC